VVGVSACDSSGCEDSKSQEKVVHRVELPPLDAIEVPESIEAETSHELKLEESRRYEPCHRLLELDAEPRAELDMNDTELWEMLIGCGADAWTKADGVRYVAYATDPIGPDTEETDLRFVAWDADGARKWSVLIERRHQGKNFVANYRQSFVTIPGARHACAGTLWEGGTTAACVNRQNGEVDWSGRMAFWAGLAPIGLEDVLYVADISSLTRRYPFSGVEMRARELDGTGGRAAFYASDGSHLYFAPARAEEPRLIKYSLSDMEPLFRRGLPDNPRSGFAFAIAEHDVVLMLFENEGLLAIDSKSGDVLWRLDVGKDRPSVAWNSSKIFVLHRVPGELNPLYAFEPRTGRVLYRAETPAGTLHVHASDDKVILRSVRAIRPVVEVVEAAE